MALINPEIVGLARVNVTVPVAPAVATASYEFVNGFEAGTPTGALPGAAAISVDATTGTYILFLDEPVDPGTPVVVSPPTAANQGGIKASIDLVQVSTPTTTAPTLQPTVELRWYYGAYGLAAPYVGVNPEKAIVVKAFNAGDDTAFTGAIKFDVVVFKNPTTIYKF